MIFLNKFLFLILLVPFVSCEKFRFNNYTLYRISPENDQHYKLLQDIQNTDVRFDFWSDPTPLLDFVTVLSSPEDKDDLEEILRGNKMKYEVTMQNIQEAIDKETVESYTRSNNISMSWNTYYTLDSINSWLANLITAYPGIAGMIIGGRSYEGRDIKGLKISHGSGRRAIFIEGGIHSREWISPSSACYIINELLTSNDPATRAAARDYDWYIFPVTNPDGYVWTHEQFRLWRKNRRPIGTAVGVDLNRNWNNNWLVSGASVNPASDIYAGPGPFSEPETLSLSEYIRSMGDRIDLYLSIHSFSQLLLIPFGNSTAAYANYHDAMNIGRRAMGALSVRYGTQYITGNIAEAIYQATGGSVDWVKEQLKVPLVYCYELRDRGTFGFLLPTDQIRPNNEEVMDSLLEMIHQAKRFGYMNSSNGLHGSLFLCFLALIIKMFH
ncbi:zinc carboxypeptidase-like [Vanessa atalanta]|uniref:zinc carboxypeptidase-like n=1 Tax=Vanessa atalanta TaxID=42275 RepID=UPI001FCD6D13|nr:zinc carboxypeptidase-like [Vanessa atalanta]